MSRRSLGIWEDGTAVVRTIFSTNYDRWLVIMTTRVSSTLAPAHSGDFLYRQRVAPIGGKPSKGQSAGYVFERH